MQFSITSIMATLATLACTSAIANAFVINTYKDEDCNFMLQHDVNIYDDSCATWVEAHSSFIIKTWGGKHQYGLWYTKDNCGDNKAACAGGYVDSTTRDFNLGKCYNLRGKVANAVGSFTEG